MDPHWRPQYDQTLQEYIDYNYIGKFENISEDLPEVLRKIFDRDIDEYLVEIVNHKTNANSKIKQYYTDEIRDMVYERYNKDFEYFEYPKDLLINKR